MTRKGVVHRWLLSPSMHFSTAKSRIEPEATSLAEEEVSLGWVEIGKIGIGM